MTIFKSVIQKALVLLFFLAIIPSALALTLQEAKEQGVIGEQRDGYVGYVVSNVSADIKAMVENVNKERAQRYQQIAQQNNITVSQVQALAFEQAVDATKSGHYLQNASGAWVRK